MGWRSQVGGHAISHHPPPSITEGKEGLEKRNLEEKTRKRKETRAGMREAFGWSCRLVLSPCLWLSHYTLLSREPRCMKSILSRRYPL